MRLPNFVTHALSAYARRVIARGRREEIGENPVLINRHKVLSIPGILHIRVHEFVASDSREFHDHPWWNVTVVLNSYYYEHQPRWQTVWGAAPVQVREAGDIIFRPADFQHRIDLPYADDVERPVTLFVHGPSMKRWGFFEPHGALLRYAR